jgi:lysophospholipase L1-like esterase
MTARNRPRHPGPPEPASSQPVAPRLRRIFWSITIALPFVVLLLVELGLRVFHYGGEIDLVLRTERGGREWFVINRSMGYRYFPRGANVPEPRDQTFAVTKGERTRRIFCLGESTMAGFPYDFHATAPSFLSDRLQQMFPADTIEVINVGLSAVGSYVILDVLRELTAYAPDLFIVYSGHNEFYGVYGVGSSMAPGSPWITRATLSLLHSRTFLLARNVYAGIMSRPAPAASRGATLMEQVVGKEIILPDAPEYRQTREVFRENIGRMIDAAEDARVPIMFSALVSNLRDHPPFRPVFAATTSDPDRQEHTRLLQAAGVALAQNDHMSALMLSERALAIDSLHAGGWYERGRALLAEGRDEEARASFVKAKDLDCLRFRAPEEFQEILAGVCASRHVTFIRTDAAFADASPHGIIGQELMTEHLHPTIPGYALMGKGFADAIRSAGLLTTRSAWDTVHPLTDNAYFALSTVSAFDSLTGAIRVALLKQHWPFPQDSAQHGYQPSTPEAVIAYDYVRGARTWSDARYAMAAAYASEQRFMLAARECLALAKAVPWSYEPVLRAADYCRLAARPAEAEALYRRSAATQPNPFAPLKLAILLLDQGRDAEAEAQARLALSPDRRYARGLDAAATSTAYYVLAVAEAKHTRFEEARRDIALALRADPANRGAIDLGTQIDAYQQQQRHALPK